MKKNTGSHIYIRFDGQLWPLVRIPYWRDNLKLIDIFIWPFRFSFSKSEYEQTVKWYEK